ncbi:thiamine-phosphate kinase [Membranihabitans marinus]|uniref:thiamine-phosphate kinase n=1 Tax=Membranihabitans marinus TaxID=1227546 RepID=UPI001F01D7CC|nr:thiamine-phosphate kinase [Membranihabitans marinus]
MEQNKRTSIEKLGEFGLISHLTQSVVTHQPTTVKGIGDDAAVIKNKEDNTVISTDMLVEGIHFDLAYHPLKHLGYKAVIVNLSDIYAMNAIPTQITVSIAISNRFSVEALEELYDGIRAACDAHQVDLIGGDTTSSLKGLIISITALGQGPSERLTYRNTAKPGDLLCVTGDLGGAYMGLQLLEREKQIFLENPDIKPDLEDQTYLVQRILKPEARKDIVNHFHQHEFMPTSMIDISDGLASEIFHLCDQSKTGAIVEEVNIPIAKETETMAFNFRIDPLVAALNGGEDYELLFTVKKEDHSFVMKMVDASIIGEIVEPEQGIHLHSKNGKIHKLQAQGWKHF